MDNFSLRLKAPYTLQSNLLFVLDELPGVPASWERSENRWGYYQGAFTVKGADNTSLLNWHSEWLGSEVVEQVGGITTFEGYIEEAVLYSGDVARRYGFSVGDRTERAPAGMFNRVRCEIDDLVENKEFEEDGSSPQVFAYWPQVVASGDSITRETTDPIGGGQSPKLTNGGSGATYLYQDIPVAPKSKYQVKFVSCGDGSVAGRYRIYDQTNGADVVPLSSTDNVGAGQFRGVSEEITTPDGCTTLRLFFYAPASSGWAIFDSVDVRLVQDGKQAQSYTSWAQQNQSVAAYGARDISLSVPGKTPSQADLQRDSFLRARAWPAERQENGNGDTRLGVFVNGWIHRAAWLLTDDDLHGVTANASTLIATIAGKLPWVRTTAIRTNTTSVSLPERQQTLLDALRMIALAGDGDGNPWRLYMDNGRCLVYEPVDTSPVLHRTGGKTYRRLGDRETVNPRLIRAMSVVRDHDFRSKTNLPGSILQQRNDSLIDEVIVGPNGFRRNIGNK